MRYGGGLELLVEGFILTCHFLVFMVTADVFNALSFQFRDALRVEHQHLEFMIDTLVGGLHIDDGAQVVLIENLIVLGLTSTNADDTL